MGVVSWTYSFSAEFGIGGFQVQFVAGLFLEFQKRSKEPFHQRQQTLELDMIRLLNSGELQSGRHNVLQIDRSVYSLALFDAGSVDDQWDPDAVVKKVLFADQPVMPNRKSMVGSEWGALNARYMKKGASLVAAFRRKDSASSPTTSLQCLPPTSPNIQWRRS